jgi:membrane protein insertase Oxa1/YidC/SpoIIIJ
MFELLASVSFPPASGFVGLMYTVLGWLSGGAIGYGLAIILFTLLLKLCLLPLDFLNKYMTKKNQLKLAEFAPEEAKLKQIYANDFMALSRAKQALYRKHGHKQGAFMLVMMLNLIITLYLFIGVVFPGFRAISNYNLNEQYRELREMHQTFDAADIGNQDYIDEMNTIYNATTPRFIWVANMWRSDTPWTAKTLTFSEFRSAVNGVNGSVVRERPEHLSTTRPDGLTDGEWLDMLTTRNTTWWAEFEAEYEAIFGAIKPKQQGPNGYLLLVILAGGVTLLSTHFNMKVMKKKAAEKEKVEAVVQYSMRDARETGDAPQAMPNPMMNPMTGKVMKFMLPALMAWFAMMNTAALALYIITNSAITTAISLGSNGIVDKFVKKSSDKTDSEKAETVINPHAKYFKKK